jgi:hypothetical protein
MFFVFVISRLVLQTIQPASPEEKAAGAHVVQPPSNTDVTVAWSCVLFTYFFTYLPAYLVTS